MLAAQRAMTKFLPLIAWQRFDRRNVGAAVICRDARGLIVEDVVVARFAAASRDQAIAYLLRRDIIGPDGRLARGTTPLPLAVTIPGLAPGRYRATLFDTERGAILGSAEAAGEGKCGTTVAVAVATDLAIAFTRK
jgi:mannan endo-1,4-beta-mannosidase